MRRELVSRFLSATDEWLNVGDSVVRLCEESDDAFDALYGSLSLVSCPGQPSSFSTAATNVDASWNKNA